MSSLDELVVACSFMVVDAVDAHGLGKGVQLLVPELRVGIVRRLSTSYHRREFEHKTLCSSVKYESMSSNSASSMRKRMLSKYATNSNTMPPTS